MSGSAFVRHFGSWRALLQEIQNFSQAPLLLHPGDEMLRCMIPDVARSCQAGMSAVRSLTGVDRKWLAEGQNGAFDPNQTSISTRKRDTLRSRWVSNRTGESRNDGAKTCSEVGHWRDHMRRRRKPYQSSLFRGRDARRQPGPMGRNGGELRQRVTRVARPYELRAARSSRCEGSLLW